MKLTKKSSTLIKSINITKDLSKYSSSSPQIMMLKISQKNINYYASSGKYF
jgi:general stress protein 26